jgi:predicted transglutaminase-like protease
VHITLSFDQTIPADPSMSIIAINIITDFIFATMPIPMFWKIQVRLRRKIVLMAILSLGYL